MPILESILAFGTALALVALVVIPAAVRGYIGIALLAAISAHYVVYRAINLPMHNAVAAIYVALIFTSLVYTAAELMAAVL